VQGGSQAVLLAWAGPRSFRHGPVETPRQVVGTWPAHSLTTFAADSPG